MKCINVEEKLSELLDDELSRSERSKVETHLESCGACRDQFENIKMLSGNLKKNLAVSAPAVLDEKVFDSFRQFQTEKLAEQQNDNFQTKKAGWFGIPRFAFATALVLFGLIGFTSFQLGKISASEVSLVVPQIEDNTSILKANDIAENSQTSDEDFKQIKIVEVPVIREKIVEVPVIKEKVVTRTVYKDREDQTNRNGYTSPQNNRGLESVAQTDTSKFQIVSELKPQIIKTGGNNDE